jgi:hypothetical protein
MISSPSLPTQLEERGGERRRVRKITDYHCGVVL